jgi:hypothetical protein
VAAPKDNHDLLIVQVVSRSVQQDVLLGHVRVPVPWISNGSAPPRLRRSPPCRVLTQRARCSFGCERGPDSIVSYEGTFKLRRGDKLDPTAKAKYEGGRVVLRVSYTPDPEA